MYYSRFFSSWVTKQNIDNSKDYDAFICFTKNEDGFVRNKLMPQLERSNPSYCIHIIKLEEITTDELDDELKANINECLYIKWTDNEYGFGKN